MSACKETRRDGKSERTEGLIERERGTALDHLKSREASEIIIRYESLRGVTKKKNHDANVISSSPLAFFRYPAVGPASNREKAGERGY